MGPHDEGDGSFPRDWESAVICDAFRLRWLEGKQPRIGDFLGDSREPQRMQLLARLLRLDREFRTAAGDPPELDWYTRALPGDAEAVTTVWDRLDHDTAPEAAEPGAATLPVPESSQASLLAAPTLPTAPQTAVPLGSAATAATAATSAAGGPTTLGEPAPRPFGDYLLLEKIAQGGMGVVYRARQPRLARIVALKMILAGEFANGDAVRRFYQEARAAATLSHPNIVAIHEVGEHCGQHFYCMDYVDGRSMDAVVKEQPLDNRQAAAVCCQVADAIHFAHQQGVLHRDLKPANVLLDDRGVPRVTDFGLAKSLHADDDELTVTGQLLGTPGYMPPEQATGSLDRIGPRSDVYSLGAMLYCFLAGRAPFHAASVSETLQQVTGRDPVPLRQINPAISIDLETICQKCLEKQPERRYPSAAALAEDLRRFLEGHPIHARRTSAAERALKWSRRHPARAGLIAVAALALVVVAAVTLYFNRQLRDSNAALANSLVAAKHEKQRAQIQASHAAQQSQVALQTLATVIDNIQSQLTDVPAAHRVRSQLLADAITQLKQVANSLDNAPETNRQLAEARLQLGLIFLSARQPGQHASHLQEAEAQFALAGDAARRLRELSPGDGMTTMLLSRVEEQLGEVARQRGAVRDALEHFERALEYSGQVTGREQQLQPFNLGVLQNKLGNIHTVMGHGELAAAHYRRAHTLLEQAVGAEVGNATALHALSYTEERIGDHLLDRGDPAAAETRFQASLQHAQKLVQHFPDNARFQRHLASRYGFLAKARRLQNDPAAALQLARQSLQLTAELLKDDPESLALQQQLAQAEQHLAELQLTLGDPVAAGNRVAAAIAILEPLAAAAPDDASLTVSLGSAYRLLGSVRQQTSDVGGAREAYGRSLKLYSTLAAQDPQNIQNQVQLALAHEYAGDSQLAQGEFSEAASAYQRSLQIRQELVEADPTTNCNNRNLSVAYNKLVMLNTQLGKLAEAKSAGLRSLAIASRLAEQHPANLTSQSDLAIALEYLGNVAHRSREAASACDYYRRSAEIREILARQAPTDVSLLTSLTVLYGNLCGLWLEQQSPETARPWAERNLQLTRKLVDQAPAATMGQTRLAAAHQRLGDVLGELGEPAEALAQYAECLEIARQLAANDAADRAAQLGLAMAQLKVGRAHLALQHPPEAVAAFQAALSLARQLRTQAPEQLQHHFAMAEAGRGLGDARLLAQEPELAAAAFALSAEGYQAMCKAFPDDTRLAENLATVEERLTQLRGPAPPK